MLGKLANTLDILLDLPVQLWVQALGLALILSLVAATVYRRLRCGSPEGMLGLTIVMMLANLIGMASAASFALRAYYGVGAAAAAELGEDTRAQADAIDREHFRGGRHRSSPLGWRILQTADTDCDGRLSPEEAADAAASFVRDGGGSLDAQGLGRAVRHIRQRTEADPPPGDRASAG